MPSVTEKINALTVKVNGLLTRIISLTPNDIIYSTMGETILYGCKVTEGSSASNFNIKLEGEAVGDEANANPQLSLSPARGYQYPNIASGPDGAFRSLDIETSVESSPVTGQGRYDIVYVYVGELGAGIGVASGTPSSAVKTDYDTNGLNTDFYNSANDAVLPVGAIPVARIYVEDVFPGITNAQIADLRVFQGRFTHLITDATTAASSAVASAAAAATSESNAATHETNAAASAALVESIYDSFDDRYLGPYASDPTLDNDGNPLVVGAFYFNITVGSMKVWNGSTWRDDTSLAEAAALAAAASETNASNSEAAALNAQTYAQEWADLAEDSLISAGAGGNQTDDYSALHHAAKASASAGAASTSESNAATSETNASTSESNAAASATTAGNAQSYSEEWANKAEDSLVSAAAGGNGTDEYSARHHAGKAAASAAAASSSETNAATSESNAAASETTASDAKDHATEWANKAEDSLISVAAGGDNVDDYSALHHAKKAEASATSAAADAATIGNEVQYASEWANKAEDTLVSAGAGGDQIDDYSAYHWAQKAAASAGSMTDAVSLQGTWDASSGSFPEGGTAQTGYSYIVDTAGTVDSVSFAVNDRIVAITDNASTSTYAGNWHHLDYTDQVVSVAGKTGAVTLDAADVASGTFVDARVAQSNVTQHQSALTITESQISDLQSYSLTGHGHVQADITGLTTSDSPSFDSVTLTGSGATTVPVGTVAQRPSPTKGMFRFNDDDDTFEGYDGTAWGPIGGASGGGSSFTETEFTATAGQTTFAVSYTPGFIELYLNGAKLAATDFTASNGTEVVLAQGAALNDLLVTVVWDNDIALGAGMGFTRYEFIATASQTTFNATYTPGYVQVKLNGVELPSADYTAVNGSTVVLNTGATLGDEVMIIVWETFDVANAPTTQASQAEMEAGTEPNIRSMSPLGVKQAIASQTSQFEGVADGLIAAGDCIVQGANGSWKSVSGTAAQTNATGTPLNLCATCPQSNAYGIAALGYSDYYAVSYYDTSVDLLRIKVMSVSGTTPTVEATHDVPGGTAEFDNGTYSRMCWSYDANKLVLFYAPTGSAVKCITATFAGTTPTWSTAVTVSTLSGTGWDNSHAFRCFEAEGHGGTIVAIGSNLGAGVEASTINVSAANPTSSLYSTNFLPTADSNFDVKWDKLNDQFIICSSKNHVSEHEMTIILGKVSHTGMVYISGHEVISGETYSNGAIAIDNKGQVVVCHQLSSTIRYFCGVAVPGRIIWTQSDGAILTSRYAASNQGFRCLLQYDPSTDKFILLYTNASDTDDGWYNIGSIQEQVSTNNPMVWDSAVEFEGNSGAFGIEPNATDYMRSSGKVVAVFHRRENANDSDCETFVIQPNGDASENAFDWMGFVAKETASDTQTFSITPPGGINSDQTGLTTGSNYWLDYDGSLSVSETAYKKVGKALSATEILIDQG